VFLFLPSVVNFPSFRNDLKEIARWAILGRRQIAVAAFSTVLLYLPISSRLI
jgi:hypothetical protein